MTPATTSNGVVRALFDFTFSEEPSIWVDYHLPTGMANVNGRWVRCRMYHAQTEDGSPILGPA